MPKSRRCDKCQKTVTKISPGLECSKCDKLVHSKSECSGLTSKQVSALRNASNLEWTCDECQLYSPPRKSFVEPEDDEDENETPAQPKPTNSIVPTIDVKKLLTDISLEVERAIKKELQELNYNVEFYSEKMSGIEQENKELKEKIKTLETTNKHLTNSNKHLETRIAALEQRHSEYEQSRLGKYIEIIGIPPQEKENLDQIVSQIASKLKQDVKRVKSAVRLNTYKGKSSSIQLKLIDEQEQNSGYKTLSQETIANDKIIIRQALTNFNKELLWQAKQKLKDAGYKYIWQKNGKILARRDDKEKVYSIRNTEDIKKLACVSLKIK
ncbi:hypothetical protein ABMA27_014740 [Loxostege sticticalis]|uniref:Zinc finger DNA binding protein n=1 Tax=Loxostege sticticalis TaxID=481309 RepID=A0ABR3IA10_LOXSC